MVAALVALLLCTAPAAAQTQVQVFPGKVEVKSSATDALTVAGDITGTGTFSNIWAGAGGFIGWTGRTRIYTTTDGTLAVANAANSDFSRLQFGGTTSSFPSLKRSGAGLQARLADDSGYAALTAESLALNAGMTATHVAIGSNPSSVGAIRIPNGQTVSSRNAANTSDIELIYADASNIVTLGLATGSTVIRSVGPHGFGGAPQSNIALRMTGTWTSPSDPPVGFSAGYNMPLTSSFTEGYGSQFSATFTEASSGAHSFLATARFNAATINADAATLANSATLYVQGAASATVDGENYSMWVAGGKTRLDGQVAIGGVTDANSQLKLLGTGTNFGLEVATALSANTGANAAMAYFNGTIVEAASGTHGLLAGLYLSAPVVTSGAATVTDTAALYIPSALSATVTGKNYAMWVDAGDVRFDGVLNFNTPTSSNPALRANSAALEAILGDASAYATFVANVLDVKFGTAVTATTGDVRLRHGFSIQARNSTDGANRIVASFGVDATDEMTFGDGSHSTRVRGSLVTPTSLANGDWWVDCTGVSPARVCAIKARDGGATRTIASVTF